MKLMPQEVEVRYVLPSLRSEITKELLKKDIKQSEIAKLLNITPAAVSQYLNKKRGKVSFKKDTKEKIKKSTKKIIKNPKSFQEEMYKLTEEIKKTGFICEIHKKYDKVPVQCEVCFYYANNKKKFYRTNNTRIPRTL